MKTEMRFAFPAFTSLTGSSNCAQAAIENKISIPDTAVFRVILFIIKIFFQTTNVMSVLKYRQVPRLLQAKPVLQTPFLNFPFHRFSN
jgi:hypothetical protein